MTTRYDAITIKAQVSKEGWIKDRPVVTRAGIFAYRTPDGKVKKEYRPDEEVFSETSLASLFGIPITDTHRGLLNQDNVDGVVGSVLSPGARQDNNVVADVIIHNPKRIGDKRELSLGYECDIDETPGDHNGERYDCIQKNIRYNHLATVSKGRAGNARLRLDSTDAVSFDLEVEPMADKLVTVRLDDIDYQAAPEVLNALNKAKDDLKSAKKRADEMEAERDTLKAKVNKHDDEMKTVRNSARDELKARLELEAVAEQQAIKFDEDTTDRDIKVKIIGKLSPDMKFDGKSDDYVDSAFDLTMDYEKRKKVSGHIRRFDSSNGGGNNNGPSAAAARERMLRRIRGEKVEDDKTAA